MLAELSSIIAPVLIIVALGYVWARRGFGFATDFVTVLVTYVATPCLIFSTLTKLQVSPAAFGQMALAGLTTALCTGILGVVVLRLAALPLRSFLPSVIFGNSGNLGLPLSFVAFGETGLALAIANFSVLSISNFTVGQWISAGATSVRQVLRQPVIYAVVAVVVFMLAGTEPPRWLANTVGLLGAVAIPLLLLSLGVALARLRLRSLGRAFFVSVIRLAGGLVIALLVATAYDLGHTGRGVLVLQGAAPAAVFNYLFAQRYGRAPEEVAGVVLTSSLMFFLALPVLLLLVL
ncbi:MAG: AEC family transporter [Alphaproteobacteria bacterium]